MYHTSYTFYFVNQNLKKKLETLPTQRWEPNTKEKHINAERKAGKKKESSEIFSPSFS
jgi:hypothetical protein